MSPSSWLPTFVAALLTIGGLYAQTNTQPPALDTKVEPVKPEPKALPQLTVPAGVSVFKADCFSVEPYSGPQGGQQKYIVTLTVGEGCLQRLQPEFRPADVKNRVIDSAVTTGGLQTLLTDANKNFTDVQSGMIDALLLVLNDQSIKADNIKDLINAAAAQITADVVQKMEKSVKAEVDRRIKEARQPARQ